MSNPYGPSPSSLADWNALLGCCCGMPVCPTPEWDFRSKTATLASWYNYASAAYSVDPTDCDVLCGKFGKVISSYAYNIVDSLPDPEDEASWEIRSYIGTLVWSKAINPFTGAITYEHSGSATFTETDYISTGDPGSKIWEVSGDPREWTIVTAGDGSEWEWDWTDGTDTDSGTFSDIGAAYENIEAELNPLGGTPPDLGGMTPVDSWTLLTAERDYDSGDLIETRELAEEFTATTLEAAATTYFTTIGWTDPGADQATRTITHPTTDCGAEEIERPACVATWSETIFQARPTIAAAHGGTAFLIDWDWAKTIDATITLTPAQWEWADPDSKTGPWSLDQKLPATEYGTLEVANVRFSCYAGPYGFLPQPDGSFPTLEASA